MPTYTTPADLAAAKAAPRTAAELTMPVVSPPAVTPVTAAPSGVLTPTAAAATIARPPDPATATKLLAQEAKNVATPNMTAAGPTAQTGPITTGTVGTPGLEQRFGTDASGRIFQIPPSGQQGSVMSGANPVTLAPSANGVVSPPGAGAAPGAAPGGTTAPPGGTAPGSGIIPAPPKSPTAPDTSKIDQQLTDLQGQLPSAEEIQRNLQAQLTNIDEKYAQRRGQLDQELADQAASEFSDLAGIGTGVNPLSSAGRSIASAQAIRKDRFLANEEALKSAEIAQAQATAYGQKTDAIQRQITFLKEERSRLVDDAQRQYTNLRTEWNDTVTQLNDSASLAAQNADLTSKQRDDAASRISKMFDLAGSKAFDGVDAAAIADLEKAAGWAAGSINAAKTTLAEKETADKQKEAAGDVKQIGSQLYQVTFDKDGKAVVKLLADATRRAGGGVGTGTTTTDTGTNPTTDTTGGKPATLAEFVEAYRQQKGFQYTPNPNLPEIQDLYQAYLGQFDTQKSLVAARKSLTSTDRKKMAAQNLDPESDDDLNTYLQSAYGAKGTGSTATGMSSTDETIENAINSILK